MRTVRLSVRVLSCLGALFVLVLTVRGNTRRPAWKVPGAPSNVVAVPMHNAAVVAWVLPPPSKEVAPVASYMISAFDSAAPRAAVARGKAESPGAVLEGLKANHCYVFSVHATNVAGDGPESDLSEPTCTLSAPTADIEVKVTAPEDVDANSELTFTITATNNGVDDATQVTLTDDLSSPLASLTTSQGVCNGAEGVTHFTCNLGAIHNGETATLTITLIANAQEFTNTASATAFGDDGQPLDDPVPANNIATAVSRIRLPE